MTMAPTFMAPTSTLGGTLTYNAEGKHFRLFPTSNPKYFAVWLYQNAGTGYELHVGTWLDCCRVMAENHGLLS